MPRIGKMTLNRFVALSRKQRIEWLNSSEHSRDCAAHSEGQLCCLDVLVGVKPVIFPTPKYDPPHRFIPDPDCETNCACCGIIESGVYAPGGPKVHDPNGPVKTKEKRANAESAR